MTKSNNAVFVVPAYEEFHKSVTIRLNNMECTLERL